MSRLSNPIFVHSVSGRIVRSDMHGFRQRSMLLFHQQNKPYLFLYSRCTLIILLTQFAYTYTYIHIYIYTYIYILYIVYIFLAAKWPSKNTILLQRGHPNYPQLHPPHLEAKPVPKPVDSDAFATLDLGFGMAEVVAIQRIQGR